MAATHTTHLPRHNQAAITINPWAVSADLMKAIPYQLNGPLQKEKIDRPEQVMAYLDLVENWMPAVQRGMKSDGMWGAADAEFFRDLSADIAATRSAFSGGDFRAQYDSLMEWLLVFFEEGLQMSSLCEIAIAWRHGLIDSAKWDDLGRIVAVAN